MLRQQLLSLLQWLAEQRFNTLAEDARLSHGSLLGTAEHVVVSDHKLLFGELLAGEWTPPHAYRWIRYESPNPMARLADAAKRLDQEWFAVRDRPDFTAVRIRADGHVKEHLKEMLEAARRCGYRA